MTMMRFRMVPDLSDSMNCALAWLIEHGGTGYVRRQISIGANEMGHGWAVRVTDNTVDALERRGLLRMRPGGHLQITDKAVGLICRHAGNTHPALVMAAAVWDQAHSEAAYRRERGLDVPPAPAASPGGYRIGTDRGECEALILTQIDQVLRLAVPRQQLRLPVEVTNRMAAAARRIADAWAADVQATPAAEPALADVALVRAEAKLTPQGWFALDRIETFIRECA